MSSPSLSNCLAIPTVPFISPIDHGLSFVPSPVFTDLIKVVTPQRVFICRTTKTTYKMGGGCHFPCSFSIEHRWRFQSITLRKYVSEGFLSTKQRCVISFFNASEFSTHYVCSLGACCLAEYTSIIAWNRSLRMALFGRDWGMKLTHSLRTNSTPTCFLWTLRDTWKQFTLLFAKQWNKSKSLTWRFSQPAMA